MPAMRRTTHFALALITQAIFVFWAYRVRAANDSGEFAPAAAQHVGVPAATMLKAVVNNGFASSAVEGDTVTAFVSAPVVVKDTIVISPGAQLKGTLHPVSTTGTTAKTRISFITLAMSGRFFTIKTEPIVIVTPVQSDISILAGALRIIVGAAIGAGMGAFSGDERLVERELLEGAAPGLSVESTVPITVILAADLEI